MRYRDLFLVLFLALSLPTATLAQSTTTSKVLGQKLLGQIQQCLLKKIPNPTRVAQEKLISASQNCFFAVVVLDSKGQRRADAPERTLAVLEVSGQSLPRRQSTGETSVALSKLKVRGELSSIYQVPVKIGAETRLFLLDTGASTTLLAAPLARQYGLTSFPVPGNLFEQGVIGTSLGPARAKVMAHTLPPLSVGNARVERLVGLSLPPNLIPGGGAGVLGLNFLSAFDMLIDPRTDLLQLRTPSPAPPEAIALAGRTGILTAQVTINGEGPFLFGLDTGADTTVISTALARRLMLNPSSDLKVDLIGLGGTQSGQLATLERFTLAEHSVEALSVVIASIPLLSRNNLDGLLGQNFLRQYRQHWRFAPPNSLGLVVEGSLLLEEI